MPRNTPLTRELTLTHPHTTRRTPLNMQPHPIHRRHMRQQRETRLPNPKFTTSQSKPPTRRSDPRRFPNQQPLNPHQTMLPQPGNHTTRLPLTTPQQPLEMIKPAPALLTKPPQHLQITRGEHLLSRATPDTSSPHSEPSRRNKRAHRSPRSSPTRYHLKPRSTNLSLLRRKCLYTASTEAPNSSAISDLVSPGCSRTKSTTSPTRKCIFTPGAARDRSRSPVNAFRAATKLFRRATKPRTDRNSRSISAICRSISATRRRDPEPRLDAIVKTPH